MNKNPLVSTIMPFWNEGKFLREAIESVLAQTYDTWQLFLVDDGSIDTSTSIALWYAEHWPQKVRYLEHRGHGNLGASAARNLGISQAEGSYIAFLDADDVWLPRTLEEQVAILDSHPEAGMVYGATEWWYSWAGNPEDGAIDRIPDLGVAPNTLLRPPILLTLMLQDSIAVPCTCSVMVDAISPRLLVDSKTPFVVFLPIKRSMRNYFLEHLPLSPESAGADTVNMRIQVVLLRKGGASVIPPGFITSGG